MPVAVVAAVALVVGVVGFVVLGGDEADAEVTLEASTDPGPDPFSESMAVVEVAEFPGDVEAVITSARAQLPSDNGTLRASGTDPGLYGGTQDETVCDADQLVAFLDDNPNKAAAWASVAGIAVGDLADFIASLTSVVLTTDTWVTNHGFANGQATPRQSVLQAGTAVMVDDRGAPRVKCGCGNPLLEPSGDADLAGADGAWAGYDPNQVAVVDPGDTTEALTVIDIDTGDTYQQNIGGAGMTDEDLLNVEVPWTAPCAEGLPPAQLVDGVYSELIPALGATYSMRVIGVGGEAAGAEPAAYVGDVTGDGADDGLILVTENCGGTGIWASAFVYSGGELLAVLPTDEAAQAVTGSTGGARFSSGRIDDDGTITLEGLQFAPEDPVRSPSLEVTVQFHWDGSAFVTGPAGGGASPTSGNEASDDAEAAVRAYLEAEGFEYLGSCAQDLTADDLDGGACASDASGDGTVWWVGDNPSGDSIRYLHVQETGGQWTVTDEYRAIFVGDRDPYAEAPAWLPPEYRS